MVMIITTVMTSRVISSGQSQTELIKIAYQHSGFSRITNGPYNEMNQIRSANSKLLVNLNYGNEFKNNSLSSFYSFDFIQFNQSIDLSHVLQDISFLPHSYYRYPSFTQLSLSIGGMMNMPKGWTLKTAAGVNYSNDFSDSALQASLTWLSMVHIEHIINQKITLGAGVFINQLENKLLIAPSISFKLRYDKIGLELEFPEKLNLWYKLKSNTYVETYINAKSLSIAYNEESFVRGLDIYTINPGIAYNYIWQDFLKLNIGIDFPIIINSIATQNKQFEFQQFESLGFNLSISIIIPDE